MELSFESGGWWAYVLIFLAAATPVLEVLVVIPAGVLAGLSPVPTALIAVAGNLTTVLLVAVVGDRLIAWWRRRRPRKDRGQTRRSQRGQELMQRWGVPGLALVAPLTTGTHIGTIAALATGADRSRWLRRQVDLAGAAGQIGWVDPTSGLSLGFVTNGIDVHLINQYRRGVAISSRAGLCVGQPPG